MSPVYRRRRVLRPWDLPHGRRRSSLWRRLSAAQLLTGSFALLIVLGTIGLKVLPGLYTGPEQNWLDALFTITSAVCVTGLIVQDTATYFTVRGQAWILLFIQLGGLGILTFTTLLATLLGRRISLRSEEISAATSEYAPRVDVARLTREIVGFTFALEAIGAVALYFLWMPQMGWREAAWPALFHSVSAFCNAGFSTFTDSMVPFQRSPVTLLVIQLLIVAGGLGFFTMEEIWNLWRTRDPKRLSRLPLSVHSRLVLFVTVVLIAVGWFLMLAIEWDRSLANLPFWHKPVNALFLSVTPRTAGFNNINYMDVDDSAAFLTILLMGVGGSPGSTAGGLKTTTVALVVLLAWSKFRRQEITHLWNRSIPDETIWRAVGLVVAVFALMAVSIFVLTLTESREAVSSGDSFLVYAFECTSAFNTVGLSMGLTSKLSSIGRLMMIMLMFVGRVGPATAATALSLPSHRSAGDFRFAYEDVVVG